MVLDIFHFLFLVASRLLLWHLILELLLMVNFKLEGELALSGLMDLPHVPLQAVFRLNRV